MSVINVRIVIKKKPAVLDVEGKTILKSLNELNFDEVVDCKKGSVIDIAISKQVLTNKYGSDVEVGIKNFVIEACKKLLVNEIIDGYEYTII